MGDLGAWKRSRRDFEDIGSVQGGYGPSRSGLLDLGRSYDDRIAGIGLRDYAPLSYDLDRPSIGAIDDPALNARLAAYGSGLGGRPPVVGYNGTSLKSENIGGALDTLPADASSTLFVEGLPDDCSRREAAHIFRPFIGFKEVRIIPKERVGGEKVNLCFVDFADVKCAATALEALQGYKFDEKDRESPTLNVMFSRSPSFRSRGRDRSPVRGRDRRR